MPIVIWLPFTRYDRFVFVLSKIGNVIYIYCTGFGQHPWSDTIISYSLETKTWFPRCLLQSSPLFANRLWLDRLRCTNETIDSYSWRTTWTQPAPFCSSTPFDALPIVTWLSQSHCRSPCKLVYWKGITSIHSWTPNKEMKSLIHLPLTNYWSFVLNAASTFIIV